MRPFSRADRVSGQIQKLISELLTKNVKDPRLARVVITGVKMSRDLRLARVYFATAATPSPDADANNLNEVMEGFQSALGYIKRTLAQRLGLRYMPELKFHYDESLDYGARIESVLKTLKQNNEPDNTAS